MTRKGLNAESRWGGRGRERGPAVPRTLLHSKALLRLREYDYVCTWTHTGHFPGSAAFSRSLAGPLPLYLVETSTPPQCLFPPSLPEGARYQRADSSLAWKPVGGLEYI